jgi:hypothetical protein
MIEAKIRPREAQILTDCRRVVAQGKIRRHLRPRQTDLQPGQSTFDRFLVRLQAFVLPPFAAWAYPQMPAARPSPARAASVRIANAIARAEGSQVAEPTCPALVRKHGNASAGRIWLLMPDLFVASARNPK